MKYYYPAIFEPKSNAAGFVLTIPDIQGCFTQSDDMEEALWMAHEAIGCKLENVAEKNYPKASRPEDLSLEGYPAGSFIKLVEFDKEKYDADYAFLIEKKEQQSEYLSNVLPAFN